MALSIHYSACKEAAFHFIYKLVAPWYRPSIADILMRRFGVLQLETTFGCT